MKTKGMKKYILRFLLLALWISLSMWRMDGAVAAEKVRLSMGGAALGTFSYMSCVVLANVWKKYIPDVDITVMATAGSTANYIPMDKGELDLAAGGSPQDWYATQGLYFTKTKLSNFCAVLLTSKAFHHTFTYLDSPIKTWKDLDGKRVHLGARASPASIISEDAFKALGIKVKPVYSTPSEAVDMMKDRRVDAMTYSVGAPWSAVLDIATQQPLKLVQPTPEERKKISEAIPFLFPDKIPAKTYPFQKEDYYTNTSTQTINARPGIPDEIVYKLTKVAWEHWNEVVEAAEAAKWARPGDIISTIALIHPGAAKYYREVGIQIPDRLIWKK